MPTSTFSLPRELRDQIYEYHLSATYRHCLPNISESRNSSPISEISDFESLQQPRYGGLEILLVSKSVHEEATPILYKCGTFLFSVKPAIISLQTGRLNTANFQNIIIDLNLDDFASLFNKRGIAIHNATHLVKHFARLNTTLPRASFVVQIGRDLWGQTLSGDTKEGKPFIQAIGGLTGFRTVTVKIKNLVWHRKSFWKRVSPYYEEMGACLEGQLGKKELGWDDGKRVCCTFHPRDGCVGQGLGMAFGEGPIGLVKRAYSMSR